MRLNLTEIGTDYEVYPDGFAIETDQSGSRETQRNRINHILAINIFTAWMLTHRFLMAKVMRFPPLRRD